jgi:ubiquinone/menaquinone biosynthesis C-methylase UbiE
VDEHSYVFSTQADDMELDRLNQQASFIDPITIRHLETIGVEKSWNCLEVGAGAGSIAQWLVSRVGSTGHVVATDIDLRFLSRLNAPTLEVRRHNIISDDLETNQYDVVHCRKVLHHVSEPETAVQKMANAVRPGGWLLLEEDDWGSMLSADVTEPSVAPFVATLRVLYDNLRKKGMVDYYFGRRVRGLIEGLRFTDVDQEGCTTMVRRGDPFANLYLSPEIWEAYRENLAVAELCTPEQYEILSRVFVDTELYYPFYTLFSAWGRKPEK